MQVFFKFSGLLPPNMGWGEHSPTAGKARATWAKQWAAQQDPSRWAWSSKKAHWEDISRGTWLLLKHRRCLLSLWSEISLHSMHYFFPWKTYASTLWNCPFNENPRFTFRYVPCLWRNRQAIRANVKKKWYLIYFKNSNKILVIRARLLGNNYRSQYPAPGRHLRSTRWSLVK